jgi:hypothetical protein
VHRGWIARAAAHAVAGMLGGAAAGAVLGLAGSALEPDARAALASVAGLVAAAIGARELLGRRLSPPQRDRETPRRWVDDGAMRWAVLNGLALGSGINNRIGFWLWYVLPATAFLTGDPLLGAAAWGLYGAVRTAAAGALTVRMRGSERWEHGMWLIRRASGARRLAAAHLAAVGVATALVVGI